MDHLASCHVMNEGWVVQFRIILPPVIRDQWYELADKLKDLKQFVPKKRETQVESVVQKISEFFFIVPPFY